MLYSAAQLTYLEQLGIDVWVPRDVPAQMVEQAAAPVQQAAPSTAEFVAPVHYEDVPAVQPPQAAQVQPAQPSIPAPPSPMTQPSVQSTVAPQSQSPAPANFQSAITSNIPAPAFPKSREPQASQTPSIEFHIQFWCYNSGVWFISGDEHVTPQQHKLVHSLAQFVQRKRRKPRHVNVFSWPMIDSPNVDQSIEVAGKYLQIHIDQLQQACEQKAVFVFDDCEYYPAHLPHVKLPTNLQQLLNSPEQKKQLWLQLLTHQLPE